MDNNLYEIDCSRLPKKDIVQFMMYLNSGDVLITLKAGVLLDKVKALENKLKNNRVDFEKKIKDLELQLLTVRALLVEDKLPKKIRK